MTDQKETLNTVFIFGAGASHDAGAPLMNDFLDKAQNLLWRKALEIEDEQKSFASVFSAIAELRSVHSKAHLDFDNLETVFGAIEMGCLLSRLGEKKGPEVTQLRDDLITVIYKTLEHVMLFKVGEREGAPPSLLSPEPYSPFMEMLLRINAEQTSRIEHRFAFITFNYDIALDYALCLSKSPLCHFDYCLNEPNANIGVPLLKLHGSINWGRFSPGTPDEKIVPVPVRDYTSSPLSEPGDYIRSPLGSKIPSYKHEDQCLLGPPVIVPPTWNKNSYHGQLTRVWAAAAEELGKAHNIFVIGYSLPETDSFFRYLYALGVDTKTRLRNFVVINKEEKGGKAEKRFRALIGKGIEKRFDYWGRPFSESIHDIGEKLKSETFLFSRNAPVMGSFYRLGNLWGY